MDDHQVDPRLIVRRIQMPGPFALDMRVPIWKDQVSTTDFADIHQFVNDNYAQYVRPHNWDWQNIPPGHVPWDSYNFFKFDMPSVHRFKQDIARAYHDFSQAYEFEPEKSLWISGWINILEAGVSLSMHWHSPHYHLSGFISLTDNTSTTFHYPARNEVIKNSLGGITIFPCWADHEVGIVTEPVRLSVAFDLFTQQSVDNLSASPDTLIAHAVQLF